MSQDGPELQGSGGKIGPRKVGRSLGCPPFSSGSVLATHGWCILDLSASSLDSTGAQQRSCGVERGQRGWLAGEGGGEAGWGMGQPGSIGGSLSLAEIWEGTSAPPGRPSQESQPSVPNPFPLLPWTSHDLP